MEKELSQKEVDDFKLSVLNLKETRIDILRKLERIENLENKVKELFDTSIVKKRKKIISNYDAIAKHYDKQNVKAIGDARYAFTTFGQLDFLYQVLNIDVVTQMQELFATYDLIDGDNEILINGNIFNVILKDDVIVTINKKGK